MYISGRPLRAGRWRCSRAVLPCSASARQSSTTRARVRSFKLERSAGPVCVDNLAVSDGPGTVVALRPVGEVTARSEPSLLRLLDSDKTGQISRACDRLSSFCDVETPKKVELASEKKAAASHLNLPHIIELPITQEYVEPQISQAQIKNGIFVITETCRVKS
ncbi:hypothetical protein MSG28_004693 [Choristoneura fumiferana]|uniref:Uncharacterized protein n=1 Tax=Choristoneura fumiferana TaxID=7141 RepID=A0ACC0K745_CHOFU|nr:hypothetical protein MSG28_004693 [Choristoneura fumiferana]